MALCATCKNRVEDGAVQCWSCGSRLDLPGSFLQVVGWVIIACSSVPFGISLVTTPDKDFIPLIIAIGVFASGVAANLAGKYKSRAATRTVLEEEGSISPPNQA